MSLKLLTIIVFAVTLGGCAAVPPQRPPLMTPLAQSRTHGYAEKTLAGGRIEVSYVGPSRRVPVARAKRAGPLEAARVEAEDLALWRAAQVAIARKARAFTVHDKRIDVDVEVRRTEEISPFGGYGYHRYRTRGYSLFNRYPFYGYGFRDAYAQARARLTIEFLKNSGPGALDALATAAQMRQKYQTAGQSRAR